MSFPSVNVTLPFGTKYSVCDRNCQFLVVSVVIEFNPFYVGSDDAEEEQANHLYQATLELKFNGYNNLNLKIDDPLGDH